MKDKSKKYELIDVGDKYNGNIRVYRIKALRDFGSVKKGDIGGYIENESNLSHHGDCWVCDDAYVINKARVYGHAKVCSNAWVFDNAEVYGNAIISGEACIYHHAKVFDNARVYDQARVYNLALVFGYAIVHGNARVKGTMKASKPVTVIDDSEVIITITDNKVHIYQSTTYDKGDLPEKYHETLSILKEIKTSQ